LRKYSSDKNYVKIKKFENSNSKSFLYNFFFTNQIYEMKKFREINCNDILINTHNLEKNKNPDVSVIITAYNQANKIYSALRSVQNQSLKNIEIIIVDDCSLDNTTEVIEKYLKEDKRIIYLRHKSNDGKIKSRSDGIRMAKGKYITIIDGDDALSNSNILYNRFL
jgi:cellulose synthase/poly-beta-1,6-N-acetylglucosamine synthase-like glycosyltransferase